MSRIYEYKRGLASEQEIKKFFEQSTAQRIDADRASAGAIAELRAENARRRLQDQSVLDADYRNYLIPV